MDQLNWRYSSSRLLKENAGPVSLVDKEGLWGTERNAHYFHFSLIIPWDRTQKPPHPTREDVTGGQDITGNESTNPRAKCRAPKSDHLGSSAGRGNLFPEKNSLPFPPENVRILKSLYIFQQSIPLYSCHFLRWASKWFIAGFLPLQTPLVNATLRSPNCLPEHS